MGESEGHAGESIADVNEFVEKHDADGRSEIEHYAHSNTLG